MYRQECFRRGAVVEVAEMARDRFESILAGLDTFGRTDTADPFDWSIESASSWLPVPCVVEVLDKIAPGHGSRAVRLMHRSRLRAVHLDHQVE